MAMTTTSFRVPSLCVKFRSEKANQRTDRAERFSQFSAVRWKEHFSLSSTVRWKESHFKVCAMGIGAPAQVQDIAAKGDGEPIPSIFLNPLKQADAKATDEEQAESIPVIDISSLLDPSLDEDEAIMQIAQASRDWGFFQVVNHGVPEELVRRMQSLALDYFHRPVADRVVDWEILTQPKAGSRDWTDSLIHYMKPALPDPIRRTNLPEGYREVLEQYVEEVLKLAETLQRAMSISLGLGSGCLREVMGEFGAVVRVNYYPPCPQAELVTGLSAHSDVGILTVLSQNDVEGLQVRKDGRWFSIPAVPNSLVINVADMLQMMTNGAFVSCDHRAFVNPHSARLSLVTFVNTPGDLIVGPLPELLDEHHPPLYRHVSFNEYLSIFQTKGLDSKASLESQRVPSEVNL